MNRMEMKKEQNMWLTRITEYLNQLQVFQGGHHLIHIIIMQSKKKRNNIHQMSLSYLYYFDCFFLLLRLLFIIISITLYVKDWMLIFCFIIHLFIIIYYLNSGIQEVYHQYYCYKIEKEIFCCIHPINSILFFIHELRMYMFQLEKENQIKFNLSLNWLVYFHIHSLSLNQNNYLFEVDYY